MTSIYTGIDLEYRPSERLFPMAAEKYLLSTIKGANRRRLAENAIASGELASYPEELWKSSLSDEERKGFGRLHPSNLGGEFLPNLVNAEIEVARITIDSTTSDVTSIYAKRVKRGIRYRVVDEYSGETLEGKTTMVRKQPLTLGKLTEFFLNAWKLQDVLEMNELTGEDAQAFVHPSSAFYPQFAELVIAKIYEWSP